MGAERTGRSRTFEAVGHADGERNRDGRSVYGWGLKENPPKLAKAGESAEVELSLQSAGPGGRSIQAMADSSEKAEPTALDERERERVRAQTGNLGFFFRSRRAWVAEFVVRTQGPYAAMTSVLGGEE